MTRWTIEQEAIFSAISNPDSGHLCVRARAGTGKSATIVEALSRVPQGTRALLTAFNKKNAEDLQRKLLVAGARTATARTLHSLGLAMLRAHYDVGVNGRAGRDLASDVCGKRAPYALRGLVTKLAARAKNCLLPGEVSEDTLEDLAWRFDCVPTRAQEKGGITLSRVVRLTDRALSQTVRAAESGSFEIDFDDMVWLPLALGATRPEYDLVVVDEAQDMSPVQLALTRSACRPGGRVVVVGDDRQAIYAFRGADSRGFDKTRDALRATELPLTRTFRCPRSVVELAREIVPDYSCPDDAPNGALTHAHRDDLQQIVRAGCYVLSRTNAGAVGACLEILRSGRPAEVAGRSVGKRILEIVEQVSRRGDGMARVLENLWAWRCAELAKIKAKFSGDEPDPAREALLDRLEDEVETVEALAEGLATAGELRERVRILFGDGTDESRVTCSTVHRAKGCERDLVVVLEDTLRTGSLEEDNIRYVAYTRTKRELVLLSAAHEPEDDLPDPDPLGSPEDAVLEHYTDGAPFFPKLDPDKVTILDDPEVVL